MLEVSPDGALVRRHPVPDIGVTNICFGGPDLRTAYCTLSGTGALVVPSTKRLAELAPAGGEAYEAEYRRYMRFETLLAVLVLVAIFFMAAKPFD